MLLPEPILSGWQFMPPWSVGSHRQLAGCGCSSSGIANGILPFKKFGWFGLTRMFVILSPVSRPTSLPLFTSLLVNWTPQPIPTASRWQQAPTRVSKASCVGSLLGLLVRMSVVVMISGPIYFEFCFTTMLVVLSISPAARPHSIYDDRANPFFFLGAYHALPIAGLWCGP